MLPHQMAEKRGQAEEGVWLCFLHIYHYDHLGYLYFWSQVSGSLCVRIEVLINCSTRFWLQIGFFIFGQSEFFCVSLNKGKGFSSVDWRSSGRS